MKVITLLNSKGGVGKTTLAINLSHLLAGKKLLVDADPQASLSDWYDLFAAIPHLDYECVEATKRGALQSACDMGCELDYNYCVIDTPGKIHDLTGAALGFSDLVIIPIQPSPLDVWATVDSLDLVRAARKANPKLNAALVINKAIANSTITQDIRNAVAEIDPSLTLANTVIHGRLSFVRSINEGKTIFYMRDNAAIQEIHNLFNELEAYL